MGRVAIRFLLFLAAFGLAWLAGERYGTPTWLNSITDNGFSFVERSAGRLLNRPGQTDTDNKVEDVESGTASEQNPATTSRPSDTGSGETNAGLRINDAGLQIIRDNEGLELEAYTVCTRSYIGYGHQLQPGEPRTITAAEAERLLLEDVRAFEVGVRTRLTRRATVNQFSAMVSLAYTMGLSAFNRSPVLERFNKGDIAGAADAFLGHNRAGGQVVEYLNARRERERALFLTP